MITKLKEKDKRAAASGESPITRFANQCSRKERMGI